MDWALQSREPPSTSLHGNEDYTLYPHARRNVQEFDKRISGGFMMAAQAQYRYMYDEDYSQDDYTINAEAHGAILGAVFRF